MFKRFLILFCLVCLPSVTYAQQFNSVINSSFYPAAREGRIIPLNPGQAVLAWKREPRYGNVVSVDILPSVTFSSGGQSPIITNGYGWNYYLGDPGSSGSFDITYSIIDSSSIYSRNVTFRPADLVSIQTLLESKNLGTVAQRQALINTFSIQFPTLIEPSALYNSFLKQLQPFILKFLAVGLILLSISKGLNYLEKLAAVKHKQREAFRKRGEKIAQARDKEYTLLEEWTVAAAVRYVENPTRLSRKEFYEQLKEYNDYRASKGWKY